MADLDGLRRFVRDTRGARGESPFFVGRQAELDFVEEVCLSELSRRARGRGAVNGIALFTGCPGVGKTALLRRAGGLVHGLDMDDDGAPETERRQPSLLEKAARKVLGKDYRIPPLVVETHPGHLTTMESLLRLCAREARPLADRLPDGARAVIDHAARGKAADALAAVDALALSQRPLVLLLVDEAQNSTQANRDLYSDLHLGYCPLPVVPVFAGLSDSEDALAAAGVSRIGDEMHISLGLLHPADCEGAMDAMFDRYGVAPDPEARRPWLDFAAEASSRFPEHLHRVLVATAKAMVARDGRLDGETLGDAAALAAEAKRQYYAARSKGFTDEEREVAAAVVTGLAERGGSTPARLAGPLLEQMAKETRQTQAPVDADGFVRRMLHSGLLQKDETGRYGVPIPSFGTWLQETYGTLR